MADNPHTERMVTPGLVEIRSGSSRTVGGYAATFNRLSKSMGGVFERINTGFFDESRASGWADVVCRWNHDSFHLLGSTAGRTLTLAVDGRGLDYSVTVPQHRDDLLELVSRRDVNSSSFAFTDATDDWSYTGAHPVRTLVSGTLIDVAPVDVAAYPGTSAALRSLAARFDAPLSDVEALAARDELAKLFVRSDRQPRRMSGRQAKVRLLERHTSDGTPIKTRKPLSGAQAKVQLLERHTADGTPIKRRLSGAEALRILAGKYRPPY